MEIENLLKRLDIPEDARAEMGKCYAKHKRIENDLFESRQRLIEAQHIAHIGDWELNISTGKLHWSDEIFNIFELDKKCSDMSYEKFLSIVHPEDREMVDAAYKKSLSDQMPYEITHRLLMSDGRIKYVHEKCLTCYGSGGDPIRSVGTVQDITENKKAEQKLLKIQKLESLGLLAGGIAHDFNNLLTGIMGNASLITIEDNPARQKKLAEDIIGASRRAAGLTQKLIFFAKGGVSEKRLCSMAEIIKESAEFSMGKNSLSRCEFTIAEDLWMAEVDSEQIGQVIQNLVINASQAMPDGGIVKIAAENANILPEGIRVSDGSIFIHIAVSDTGIGIPDKYQEKIFDPYFTTKGNSGSGLGLAVVYSVIKKHEGFITLDSEQGRGTTFHVYLPATLQKIEEEKKCTEVAGISAGLRILIMDDEPMVREMLQIMLSNHHVEVTEDGSVALEKYAQALESGSPFDLAILDLTVPGGMGGEETLRKIREIDPGAVAIVSTGYSENIPTDFDGMLLKPYSFRKLNCTIKEALHLKP